MFEKCHKWKFFILKITKLDIPKLSKISVFYYILYLHNNASKKKLKPILKLFPQLPGLNEGKK